MKKYTLLIASIGVFIFTSQSVMADRFVAVMTGVTSYRAKNEVKASFKRLPGVKSVRFTSSGSDTQKAVVITDGSAAISKQQAIASLGKYFSTIYKVQQWNWYEN